ncbi:class I SAM-dependent methyltransferase [Trichlorobacter ammonificans]|uniref:Enzyme n=1 Tax=Trichlorobacter ammonificans TaxID=2916410 RepID=A0ABN8HEW1_9BACT|nr:DUF1698 domain-containing protein [Trichlorobacter ammonificans]CAH2029935.1 putative enzyme [Trichlorobacter ammonificans]
MRKDITDHNWFHAIDFGNGTTTPGRFTEKTPPNWTLYGVLALLEQITLPGMSCLDIGTMDGLISLILKAGGASRVVATDVLNRPTFEIAREISGQDIEYYPDIHINDLPQTPVNSSYDLITFSGVLYHLYDPLGGIATCRKLIARNGLLILETETTVGSTADMKFTPAYNEYPEPYTYWQPTIPCLLEMLKFCCFEPTVLIKTLHRTTVLATAVLPAQVSNRTDRMIKTHQETRGLGPYLNFKLLASDLCRISNIEYTGHCGSFEIDPHNFFSRLPYQPNLSPQAKH